MLELLFGAMFPRATMLIFVMMLFILAAVLAYVGRWFWAILTVLGAALLLVWFIRFAMRDQPGVREA